MNRDFGTEIQINQEDHHELNSFKHHLCVVITRITVNVELCSLLLNGKLTVVAAKCLTGGESHFLSVS